MAFIFQNNNKYYKVTEYINKHNKKKTIFIKNTICIYSYSSDNKNKKKTVNIENVNTFLSITSLKNRADTENGWNTGFLY